MSLSMTAHSISAYITALRPWTWTASIVPVVVLSILMHVEEVMLSHPHHSHSKTTLGLLLLFICVQSGANAINTVEDYKCGVDSKHMVGGDRALVDKTVDEITLKRLGYFLLLVSGVLGYVMGQRLTGMMEHEEELHEMYWTLASVFITGIILGAMYSAWPLRLKHRALGDVVVFICFGPLLMTFCSILLTGNMHWKLTLPYSIPVGVLTEAILHANNARDIKDDARAGIVTLATLIGFAKCRSLYSAMIACAYGVVLYLAIAKHTGLLVVTFTAPLAMELVRGFQEHKKDKMASMDENTAKFHLSFGLLMGIGLYISTWF